MPYKTKKIEEYQNRYKRKHHQKIINYMREYSRRPEIIERSKKYWGLPEIKLKRKIYQKEYFLRPETKHMVSLRNKRLRKQPLFYLRTQLTKLMQYAFKSKNLNKNSRSWIKLLNYTPLMLKEHLEKQFTPLMNWKNYGTYWHIDHKIPICFATNEMEIIELFALDNLQPLEGKENQRKGNRVIADLFGIEF